MDELGRFISSPPFNEPRNPQPSSSADMIDLTDDMDAPKEAAIDAISKIQKAWAIKTYFCQTLT